MRIDIPLHTSMDRRSCLRSVFILSAGLLAGLASPGRATARSKTKIVIVKTSDRAEGVKTALANFDLNTFRGGAVTIKANYNSADPFPASTHPATLHTLGRILLDVGASRLTLAERSGMGDTPHVLKEMGADRIAEELGMEVVILDDLGQDGYVHYAPADSHWQKGFLLARPFVEADQVVQTCCLKTHQYGGHFTLSLKNAVGAVAKYDPKTGYNYMRELHGSAEQRAMIAEISQVYRNDLIVMDGMKAFVTGGPHSGKEVAPGVIIAGTDPVAVDAVGVAILRMFGTTREVSAGTIFEQEQIRRAAELGIGVQRPDDIELVGHGDGADEFIKRVKNELG